MEFHVTFDGRSDLSGEIYRQLRAAILMGRLRPGEYLPQTRELARRLSVARSTVTTAYERLSGDGFIATRVGAGTFVAHSAGGRARGEARKCRSHGVLQPRSIWESMQLPNESTRSVAFDFRAGLPDSTLFPHDSWGTLVSRAQRSKAVREGGYADPAGHAGLREAISRYIGVSRGMEISSEDVTIVNGTQQGLDVVARALLAPGDCVAVEEPGNPLVRCLFESLGLDVASVPVDEQGLIVDRLPERTRLVYVTPSHQYPLGVSMTVERRHALLDWAQRTDAAIFEDDSGGVFRFRDRPLETLYALDRNGRVIYASSFSTMLLPAIRIGFVVPPSSLRVAVHRAKHVADRHTPLAPQVALGRFIESGELSRHVRKMRQIYGTRRDMIADVMAKQFADEVELVPSTSGLHLTALARTSSTKQMSAVVHRATLQGLELSELSGFYASAPHRSGLVLGYGAIATASIEEGLQRLRHCFGLST